MKTLLYLLEIFTNGALLIGSIFVGSKAWNLLVSNGGLDSGLDTLKYVGWLALFTLLVNLLNMEKFKNVKN